GFVSDTGLHQELRCLNRSIAENDFPRGFGAKGASLAAEINAGRPAAIESNSRRHGARQHREVGLGQERVHVGAEDRPPPSPPLPPAPGSGGRAPPGGAPMGRLGGGERGWPPADSAPSSKA